MQANPRTVEYERLELSDGENVRFEKVLAEDAGYYTGVCHFHDMHELVLFDSIEGHVRIDGEATALQGACLVYLAPFVLHQFDIGTSATSWYLFQFDRLFLERLGGMEQMGSSSRVLPLNDVMRSRMMNLGEWFGESRSPDIVRLLLSHVHSTAGGNDAPTAGRATGRFRELLQYLDANRRYAMSVNEAAGFTAMSRSHFLSEFRKQFNMTFNRFLTNRRMNAAIFLLKDSELNITEISGVLEFNDSSYFTRVFRQETGVSPRDFRK